MQTLSGVLYCNRHKRREKEYFFQLLTGDTLWTVDAPLKLIKNYLGEFVTIEGIDLGGRIFKVSHISGESDLQFYLDLPTTVNFEGGLYAE